MYAPNRLDPQIIGEKGSLYLKEDHVLFEEAGTRNKGIKLPLTAEVGHGGGIAGENRGGNVETAVIRMYEDFYNCVQNHSRPFVGVDQAMAASKVAWLADLAAKRNAQVLWSEIS